MRLTRATVLLIAAATGCGDNQNVGPTGADQSVETDEDTPIAIELAGSDANGDPLDFTIVRSPASGTLSGTAPDVTYTPDADFFGADMFVYAVSDAEKTEAHQVFIMVLPVNDGPTISIAMGDAVTDEDVPAGPLLLDVADVDDDLATLAIDISSSNTDLVDAAGIEIDRSSGQVEVTLTPLPDANGTTQLAVTVTDPTGESASSGFSLEVAPVNDAPTVTTIADQSTQRDPVNDIAFAIADIDSDIADLTVSATSDNQAVVPDGNLTLAGAGTDRTISVEPTAGGTANITVTVSDGADSTDETFVFDVTNKAPNAEPDSYAGIGNTVLSGGGLLANDSDDDGDGISLVDPNGPVGTAMGGFVVINATDDTFVYTPPVGITGATDSFQYQVTDGFDTSTGTAAIELTELVWYVKNDVADTGDGRSSSPFKTLAEAETASDVDEIIYVFAGDGTATGQDAGITLVDGQRLIGAGVPLVVGGVTLQSADSNPVITNTNTDGRGIELADGNTVAGLTIDEPDDRGIRGPSVTSLTIESVTINANNDQAIDIGNNNPDVDVNIDITNCTINGTGTAGVPQVGIDVEFGSAGGTAALALDITGNFISGVDDGVLVNLEGTTGTGAGGVNQVTIDNNIIADFSGAGLDLRTDGASNNDIFVLTNLIDGDVSADTSTQAGLDVLIGHNDANGVTDLTVDSNEIIDAGDECILLSGGGEPGNSGTLNALINNNQLTSCVDEGLRVFADDEATYNVSATNNTLSGNGSDTIFEFATNTAAFLRVLLDSNDDDQGYVLDCDATGDIELAAPNGQGTTLDCSVATDDVVFIGHLNDQGNTTGGGPPVGSLTGSGNTIEIIDPSGVPQPTP